MDGTDVLNTKLVVVANRSVRTTVDVTAPANGRTRAHDAGDVMLNRGRLVKRACLVLDRSGCVWKRSVRRHVDLDSLARCANGLAVSMADVWSV